jgi:3-phenylpropionate/trans-cinnamate dioxygenase ferredoxin reductase subunit
VSIVNRVVIIGGGLGGASAAFELRERGFAGTVTLVSAEAEPPYQRPQLSKEYLRGEKPLENGYVRPVADYAANRVELLRGHRAVAVELSVRRVALDDGTKLPYDALVIATGSAPRRLDVPGADLSGIHYLRDAGDADALRTAAASAAAIAVVGGGWNGSEVAASLRQLGHPVTLITPQSRPLEGVLGAEVAEAYRSVHQAHGVCLVQGRATRLDGRTHVEAVQLADGSSVEADLVVVGIGAVPRIELAAAASLALEAGGIAVDEFLRTSEPGVYAVGDVAAAWHPRYRRRLRLEHWDNAQRQGKAAAGTIVGDEQAYARIPYFYSDQFDLGMEYRGFAQRWDRVVIRGDLPGREFHAFWLAGGRVVAAMNANLWRDGKELRRMVEAGVRVDPARLADTSLPLSAAA